MPERQNTGPMAPHEAVEDIARAVADIPFPFAVYNSDDRVLVASRTFCPDGAGCWQHFLDTPVFLEDAVHSYLSTHFPADLVDTYLRAELDLHARNQSGAWDLHRDGAWVRRFRSVSADGHLVSMTIPIDELVRKADELNEKTEELERLAFLDPLTGLPNRRGLSEHLKKLAATPEREAFNVAVLHVDLDKFKLVNDTFGHDAGDCVLVKATEVLRSQVRPDDYVARVGGDEFVVVIHTVTSEEAIANCAQRIVDRMADPIEYGDDYCQIGASIGAAITSSHNISEHVLMDADIALYEAKNKGRGRFEFFYPAVRDRFSLMQRRAYEVREALTLNAFEPYFQPQICGDTGDVVGLEALARWIDRERGVRTYEAFMPALHEARLTEALDDMIIRKSLKAIKTWNAEGIRVPRVWVNLSEGTLLRRNLVDHLKWMLDEQGLDQDAIGLEVLENFVVNDGTDDIMASIDRLERAGFQLALDDFGTGNTPIVGLRKLSVGTVKIDQDFVGGLDRDTELQTITRAMVALVRNLNLEPIAEGVETATQAAALRSYGVRIMQGHFFSKPMPADFVPVWVEGYDQDRRAQAKSA